MEDRKERRGAKGDRVYETEKNRVEDEGKIHQDAEGFCLMVSYFQIGGRRPY